MICCDGTDLQKICKIPATNLYKWQQKKIDEEQHHVYILQGIFLGVTNKRE
jgi:hypothetical protein